MDINQGRMVQNDILMRSLSLNRKQWVQSNYRFALIFLSLNDTKILKSNISDDLSFKARKNVVKL